MKTNHLERPRPTAPAPEPSWLRIVRMRAERLRYGSIHVTVHDGRVTQVESIEKTRFLPSECGQPLDQEPTQP